MINRIQAAADCLAAAKLLYKRHLVNAYEGNVSIRVGDSIFITPTQICKELLTPDDLVEVDIASGAVIRAGKVRRSKLYYLRDRVGKAARVKEASK